MGTRLKFNLQGFGYFQFGVFDANPNYLSVQQSALPVFYSGFHGPSHPGRARMAAEVRQTAGQLQVRRLVRHIDARDVVTDVNGNPAVLNGQPLLQSRGRYDVYVNFLQQVITPIASQFRGCAKPVFQRERWPTPDGDHRLSNRRRSDLYRPTPSPGRGRHRICGRHHPRQRPHRLIGRAAESGWPRSGAVQGNEYSMEFYYSLPAARRPAGATEHPIRDRPRRHQHEFKRIGVRTEDGCEFLTPHQADRMRR